MNILVNGGSLSRGPGSWPYVIGSALEANIVNLSLAGSGNTYVHETTIAELAQRQYDLVLIQWTPFLRFDFKVKDINQFDNTIFTSKYQRSQNDWPEKVIEPINDQDYVEPNWIFGCGVAANNDPDPTLNDAFGGFYRYCGPSEQMYHSVMKIVSLQSFLKLRGIPHLSVFGRHFRIPSRFSYLSALIDWDLVYTDHYILNIAEQSQSWDLDGLHPSSTAYAEFAERILPKIRSLL